MKTLLDSGRLYVTLQRLAHQVIEQYPDGGFTILGLQPRGVPFAERIAALLKPHYAPNAFHYGKIDATFHRDDVHMGSGLHLPSETDVPASLEGGKVILVDDVLHTGRSIRATLDALLHYGRPREVKLMVLIDRRFSRQLPVQPDYTGLVVDTVMTQQVRVSWHADDSGEVVLLDAAEKGQAA